VFRISRGSQAVAYFGLQVGRFDGDEVYAADGCYLGEIMNENRPTDSSIPFLR
jgi:hypothetical protein